MSIPKLNFRNALGVLAGLLGIAPIIIIGVFFAAGPYANWGPFMEVTAWSIGCGVLSLLMGLVCLSYDEGRRSTQDPELIKKEQRRQEYLKLKEEFDDTEI